eukprot:4835266-Pyramimonas_sp.AAC.1
MPLTTPGPGRPAPPFAGPRAAEEARSPEPTRALSRRPCAPSHGTPAGPRGRPEVGGRGMPGAAVGSACPGR